MSGSKTVTRHRKTPTDSGAKKQECRVSDVCCDEIREKAYYRWESAGCPGGDGVEFWLEAEAELTSSNRPAKPR